MLLLQTLKSHLNEECTIIYREFSAICGTNIQAAAMLAKFVYWSDVVHRTQPEKCGWFFKTARHLYEELGFTRRAYEKARSFLVEKGLLQYRRGGVHGKMHFCVNFDRLLEMVYEIKGMVAPKNVLQTQIDRDNYSIPKFIPLDKWHDYLDVYKEKKGKFPSNRQKSALIKQLARLHGRFELNVVMERSIVAGWIGFYSPEYQPSQVNIYQEQKQIQAVKKEIREKQKQRERQAPPLTEAEKQGQQQIMVQMMMMLKQAKKW